MLYTFCNLLICVAPLPAHSTTNSTESSSYSRCRCNHCAGNGQYVSGKHPKYLHLLTASPIGSLSLSNKGNTFLHLPHSILSQTDAMTTLYFLRMASFTFYIQKPLLHLRRLLHKQEPQHGLEPNGAGEDALASLRTCLA